jgi:peptidyl-prolyl cis-trans isomerase-like 4
MSVLLDTSVGEIVIDLFDKECPVATNNFLKLCKFKYYNNCLIFNIQPNLIAQTGDPTGTGSGGNSIFGLINKISSKTFKDEIAPPPMTRKFNKVGLVAMANTGENTNKSQFFITLRGNDISHFDGKYTIFGEVAEGFEALEKLNNLYIDGDGRPYQDVRIR